MKQLHDFQFFTLETLIIQTVILLLILWVLNKFIFKPYLEYLDKESEKRKKLENDYRNIEKLNKEAIEAKEALLASARIEASNIKKDAIEIAKKEAQIIKDTATQEALNIKASALNEIEKEKEAMLSEIKSKSIDLILKFNAKLFSSERVAKDFVETQIASIKE